MTKRLRGQRGDAGDGCVLGVSEGTYRALIASALRAGRTLKATASDAIHALLDDAEARRRH